MSRRKNEQLAIRMRTLWLSSGGESACTMVVAEGDNLLREDVYIIPTRGGIMSNLTSASKSSDIAPAWSR